jgi:hypothetical protein
MQEDQRALVLRSLRSYNLGSTVPVLRLMIQQSNCFVIVERGGARCTNMMHERNLMRGDECAPAATSAAARWSRPTTR